MGYFSIGLVIGLLMLVILPILTFKNRWFNEDDFLEGFYKWWDGTSANEVDMSGAGLYFFVVIVLSFATILLWALILPIILIIWLVNSIRNKKLNKNK